MEFEKQFQATIKKGSKSFALASWLLPREQRAAAHYLYAWCRYCDDAIDFATETPVETLQDLREKTEEAFTKKTLKDPIFHALQVVVNKYDIPKSYALDLLAGFEMDIENKIYLNYTELDVYCYRVAGVVGLMMCHVLGATQDAALDKAIHMGSAMQMTNIARDVFEDAAIGRIYLPQDLLKKQNIPPIATHFPYYKERIAKAMPEFLAVAEEKYKKGDQGLRYLPYGSRLAIASARKIYSQIGNQILQKKEKAWDSRVWTSPSRKLACVLEAFLKTLSLRFQ